jgi:hypothetical protein
MTRGQPYTPDSYAELLEAMRSAGGELPAKECCDIIGCSRHNLGARLSFALETGLIHRKYHGRLTCYAVGPRTSFLNPDEAGLDDFEPVLHGDGTLVLLNCPLNSNDVPQLSRAQTRVLRKLLTGDLLA